MQMSAVFTYKDFIDSSYTHIKDVPGALLLSLIDNATRECLRLGKQGATAKVVLRYCEVEDIVTEVYLRLSNSINKIKDKTTKKGQYYYIISIVKNYVIDEYRRLSRFVLLDTHTVDLLHHVTDRRHDGNTMMEQLPTPPPNAKTSFCEYSRTSGEYHTKSDDFLHARSCVNAKCRSKEDRTVMLAYMRGYTSEDVSRRTGHSLAACKSRKYRVLNRVRRAVGS